MRQLWITWLLMAGVCLTLSGCGSSGPRQTVGSSEPQPAAEPASTSDDPNAVTVSVQSWDETQQLVARNQGKVVVIDLWTSW